ncbi:c-type cytochrome [bacterium]|nr:c-type cytochrome [bacterium]
MVARNPFAVVAAAFAWFAISSVAVAQVATQKSEVQESVTRAADGTVVSTVAPAKKVDVSGGPAVTWIWNQGSAAQTAFLRKSFEANAKSAALIATCDNGMTVRLNGEVIARSSEWQQPVTADVTKALKQGTNEITADVTNEGGTGGFALKLVLTKSDGSKAYVVSDTSWTMAKDREFKDLYEVKTEGEMGVGPWGDVFSNPGGGSNLLKGAVPHGVFQTQPGFQVELLYTVPKETQGSWVCITFDDRGRIIASDQGGQGLYRITPAPLGSEEPTQVEKLDLPITSAQGMLWAFDSLYLSVNGGPGSGLYRATDSDGDGELDKIDKLSSFRGGGEHGPHALRLSPDGKSIYVIAGNHTDPPEKLDASRIPTNWGEDHLLPRQWDARGHARGRLAPGGWIAKTDPEGKTWEIVSIGYRNPYDFDFTPDGELFAYDADMEWDMGTSWYRPTRVVHAISGSEFGWRSGTGKWPTYYVDSLPPVVNIGPGSPVGVSFGTGTKFPPKYQRALYCCDWTFGTIYAIHLTPQGSTYVGQKEEFVARTPLPLTDIAVGPDGALYFTIGGRNTDSALFRVTYTGEPVADDLVVDVEAKRLRELRHHIEAMQSLDAVNAEQKAELLRNLASTDRFIRYATRIAIEKTFSQVELADLATTINQPGCRIVAAVAFARQSQAGEAVARRVIDRLLELDIAELSAEQQLDLLRAFGLLFIRQTPPSNEQAAALIAKLDPLYPSKSSPLNRELCQMLVYLNSPTVIAKTLKLMEPGQSEPTEVEIPDVLTRNAGYGGTVANMLTNMPNLDQIHFALCLRNMKFGWTLEQRQQYIEWIADASTKSGGASYKGFLQNIQKDFLDNATEAERKALESEVAAIAPKEDELPKPIGPGKTWSTDELLELTKNGLSGRSFEGGKRAFSAARCISCHRFAGEGGSTGPDLTNLAGRFGAKDVIESNIEPSKVVSDQYRASIITTNSGRNYTGRILNEANGTLTVLIDPVDATKIVEIKRSDIDEILVSPTSLMPAKLLDQLNTDEVLDLLAYLMSRGNPNDPAFTK